MADLDQEYEEIVLGLHERFATVAELQVILDYEPTSAQDAPLLYSILDGFECDTVGTVTTTVWRSVHRLCIRWQDSEQAEKLLRLLACKLLRAVLQQPRLMGRVRGVADIVAGEAGWAQIGDAEYRTLDLVSEVLVRNQYPAG